MRICMIGLGSIGKRHCENIKKVLSEKKIDYSIDALRSKSNREYSLELENEYYDMEDLPNDYDVIFVTNPTSMHYDTICKVINKTKHIFIEKPVFDKIEDKINQLPFHEAGIYYVACPLRYKMSMKKVKEIIRGKQIYSVRAISSSYLPDWRKNTDYRKTYSSKRELGGGVTLDLIHEWDYLIYLFGLPSQIMHMEGHFSDLAIDVEDISTYMAKYDDKIIELHLDYFGRENNRELEIFCKDCVIKCDFIKDRIHIGYNNYFDELECISNDFYLDEMRNFFEMVQGISKNTNSIYDAYRTLGIALS